MCVAVLVDSSTRISNRDLRAMARENPHGGGIAWVEGEHVRYRRGLGWKAISKLHQRMPKPQLIHFRIATKGSITPHLTHPFPVGMAAFTGGLEGSAPAVIVHNGTWHDYQTYVPPGIDRDEVSDTQVAAYVAKWDEDILDDVMWSNAIMRAAGGGRADVVLRGQWTEYQGNMYSNLHWLPDNRWKWKSQLYPNSTPYRIGSAGTGDLLEDWDDPTEDLTCALPIANNNLTSTPATGTSLSEEFDEVNRYLEALERDGGSGWGWNR